MWKRIATRLQAFVKRHFIGLFALARNTLPILKLGKRVRVMRRADVLEVLGDNDTFMVTYEPKMRMATGGSNFFLGMGDTAEYHRQVNTWHRVFPATLSAMFDGRFVDTPGMFMLTRPGDDQRRSDRLHRESAARDERRATRTRRGGQDAERRIFSHPPSIDLL